MKTSITLKACPFCGCQMTKRDGYLIYGNHSDECYFTLVDNQHMIDFSKEETLTRIYEAWNKRTYE